MADEYRRPYLDSSVFIAWLRGETNTNGVNRKAIADHILDEAKAGNHPIVISALTFAEVHKVKGDNKPHLTVAEDEKILAYFEHEFFRVVDVDRTIGEEANRFCRLYNIKPNDAIHLACALRAKCDVLLFWDRPVVASVTHKDIRVEEPRIIGPQQTNFLKDLPAAVTQVAAADADVGPEAAEPEAPEEELAIVQVEAPEQSAPAKTDGDGAGDIAPPEAPVPDDLAPAPQSGQQVPSPDDASARRKNGQQ